MRKTALRLLTIGALAFFSLPACAGLISGGAGGGSGGACPNTPPDGEDDGCATATHVGLIRDVNWFTNTVNWNDQSVTPPTWNVAYVQYGVGQYTATGSLSDPTNNANLPAGCSYSSSDRVVNCTGSGSVTITGLYFNDIALYFHGSYTSVSIINNKFLSGSHTEAQFQIARLDDEGVTTNFTDDWNTYDSVGTSALTGLAQVVGDNRTTAHSGTTEHHYNAVLNTTSKFVIQDACADPNIKFNAYLGWPAPSGDTNHAEVSLVCHKAETMAKYTVWFNTSWIPRDGDNTAQGCSGCEGGATAIDFMTAGFGYGQTYTSIDVRYNVYNINKNNNTSIIGGIQAGEAAGIQAGTYGSCLWKKNFIFAPGADFAVADSSSGCTTTWTSNVNMRTGAAISAYNTVP